MVQPESWITGRNIKVRARIARDGEVACWMYTCAHLHCVLEFGDSSRGCDERSDLCGGGIALGEVVGEVALDAAGVVAVAICAGVFRRRGIAESGVRTEEYQRMFCGRDDDRTEMAYPRLTFMSLKGPLAMQPPP